MIENEHALALLDRAIALDPTYSAGYALAARCYQFQRLMGWVAPNGPHLERGVGFARLAAELGKNDSEALWMAAHAMPHLAGEVDLAKSLVDRSIALNPNSSSAWSSSCFVYTLLGQFEKAIDDFQRSHRLNPLDHTHHLHWNIVGMAHFGARQYMEANAAADKTLSVSPAYPQALRLKIAACGALGRSEEARAFVQRLLAVHPSCSLKWLEEFNGPMMAKSPELLHCFLEAARVGGIPSRPSRAERRRQTLQ